MDASGPIFHNKFYKKISPRLIARTRFVISFFFRGDRTVVFASCDYAHVVYQLEYQKNMLSTIRKRSFLSPCFMKTRSFSHSERCGRTTLCVEFQQSNGLRRACLFARNCTQ